MREFRRLGVPYRTDPLPLVGALNVAILALAAIGAIAPSVPALAWVLLMPLARPMLAFVLVLGEPRERS